MSLIEENYGRLVRMANLAVVGSHTVNGVAKLHSELMKQTIFRDFAELYPDRFTNVTNGIAVRRWLKQSNPGLSALLTEHLGHAWENDLEELERMRDAVDDDGFRQRFRAIKQDNKEQLAEVILRRVGVDVDVGSLFDVQVKRIHEYKRQLLNLLYVITRYNRLRENPQLDLVPRTVIFAGKAAPGYYLAKSIIRLINNVARVVNDDRAIGGKLRVVFLPDYDVSLAQRIMPAADLSEQISTAGMEASGTGNMKLALNGALTIGTLDGANIEIREAVGAGEHLHLRSHGGGSRGAAALGLLAERDRRRQPRARENDRPDRFRSLFARQSHRGPARRRAAVVGGRDVLRAGGFRCLCRRPGRGRRALPRHRRLDAQGGDQHAQHGRVLERSQRARVRAADLAHQARAVRAEARVLPRRRSHKHR